MKRIATLLFTVSISILITCSNALSYDECQRDLLIKIDNMIKKQIDEIANEIRKEHQNIMKCLCDGGRQRQKRNLNVSMG